MEYLREKQQYVEVIDSLTEENINLRQIIGGFENRFKGMLFKFY